uniref:MYND-type domain-containing protein n=1 Tax=Timema genevievae TaxID=629358 RepID=A0A7R9PLW1_TIMGE|nr:unnamed protein product [Timema genevievae]
MKKTTGETEAQMGRNILMAVNNKHDRIVDVGYINSCVEWRLGSRFFPSKVGGKPAWLDLKHIPDNLKCKECGKPCVFLCQVYAPIEDVESCFHRTIFIFVCRDPICCKENSSANFKVFRCQLKRRNNYFSFNPPIEKATWQPDVRAEHFLKLCAVCGARGQSHCGKCRKVNYCGREHQTLDWKAGHRNTCASGDTSVDEHLLNMAGSEGDDFFLHYNSRIKQNPGHVLRYDRGGEPLWVSGAHVMEVPPCPNCGAPRVLSTLLNHLGLDTVEKSIDWGTLLVYTCEDSCDDGPIYKEEFIYKQDIAIVPSPVESTLQAGEL